MDADEVIREPPGEDGAAARMPLEEQRDDGCSSR